MPAEASGDENLLLLLASSSASLGAGAGLDDTAAAAAATGCAAWWPTVTCTYRTPSPEYRPTASLALLLPLLDGLSAAHCWLLGPLLFLLPPPPSSSSPSSRSRQ